MRTLRIRTPAKVNLFLRVLGRRPDGYHAIETIFQAIDLEDEVVLTMVDGESSLEVPGFPELSGRDNLVLKAVRALETHTERRLPMKITLCKGIPVAAGLGGGSSDAAAVLAGAQELFDLALPTENLHRIARTLGADVPFFLRGGSAVGEGIGDILTPVELPMDYGLVLVNPGFPVVTGSIYAAFSRTLTGEPRKGKVWDVLRESRSPSDMLVNDLQPPAERLHPAIRDAREALERAEIPHTLMSGSGATVFGIVGPDRHGSWEQPFPAGWTVISTRPVSRGCLVD